MTIAEAKRRRNAPCLYLKKSEKTGKEELWPPAVDCGMDCKDCGFNPDEKARRLAHGEWVEGKWGIRHLVFKPVERS